MLLNRVSCAAFCAALGWVAAVDTPTDATLSIRGREQRLRLYGSRGGPPAVVASGDGGWVHLGPHVAEYLAGRGYFVVGFDSKAYLASFTHGSETLRPGDVPGDVAQLVAFAAPSQIERPLLVGVSEGAALLVLAAGDAGVKPTVSGIVALGLPDRAELGWRFRDSIIYITKGVPHEPTFSTAQVVDRLAPLPLAAIHSTHDEFVPVDEIERVVGQAKQPKRLWLIEAENHAFAGNEPELHEILGAALDWIAAQPPAR